MCTLRKLKNFVYILPLAACFGILFAAQASGAQEDQDYLLELVNGIRQDPFSYAETLGYDRNLLAETLPWLKTSYAPLAMNVLLNAKASAGDDPGVVMEASPFAATPATDYLRTADTGGTVAFLNFLPLEKAFEIVVRNLVKKDLDPNRIQPLTLLSDDYGSLGIAVKSGVQEIRGVRQNVYRVKICLGSSLLRSEAQVLNMVNQVRSEPNTVSAYLGENLFSLLGSNVEHLSEWFRDYPPLMDNAILNSVAAGHSRAMAQALQDAPPLERAEQSGYEGFGVTESAARSVHPAEDGSAQVAARVFSSLVRAELAAAPERGAVFSLDANDGGVGIAFDTVDETMGGGWVTLDAGDSDRSTEGTAGVYGIVYADTDGNGVYSPGEGRADEPVVVVRGADGEVVRTLRTDNAGRFVVTLEDFQVYRFDVSTGETMIAYGFFLDQDRFLPVPLSLPSDAPRP